MKNVLVLAYYYPPLQRVGGRRWHLFVKYLQRHDITVTVITCEKAERLANAKEEILYVPDPGNSQLPYYKRKLPSNILGKIIWKISYIFDLFRINWIGYDHYDLSLPVIEDYLTQARQVLKSGKIDTVFLTVSPFAYSTAIADLKQEFPQVFFAIDYRDERFHVSASLTKRQFKGEKKRELAALEAADLITAVDSDIAASLYQFQPHLKTPVEVVPHGYDEEDFAQPISFQDRVSGPMRLVYGGACYAGVAKYFDLFKLFKEASPSALKSEFYFSYLSADVKELLRDMNDVKLSPPVSRKEMLEIQQNNSDFNLIFYPDNRLNSRSSKFYELIRCGKPIMYFGPDGPTASFIRVNKLGITFCSEDDVRQFNENLSEVQIAPLNDLKQHTIPVILSDMLEKIARVRGAND